MNFLIQCLCSSHPAQDLMTVINGDLAKWQSVYQSYTGIICPNCGCKYNLADQGTTIDKSDCSQPRIDSVSPTSGPATGGTPVVIFGHRMNLGTVVVRFGGAPVTNTRSQSDSSITIDTPAGSGVVDVTVENENGQRLIGGTLVGAFTFA